MPYTVVWLIGVVASMGLAHAAPLKKVWETEAMHGPLGMTFFLALLLLDGLLLWRHVVAEHLTRRLAGPPFAGTFVLLLILYSAGYGLVRLMGEAHFVLIPRTYPAWEYTLRCVGGGAATLAPFLLGTAWWRGTNAQLDSLRDARYIVVRMGRRLLRRPSDSVRARAGITVEDKSKLRAALTMIQGTNGANLRLRTVRDEALIHEWWTAAKAIGDVLLDVPASTLPRVAEQPRVRLLLKEQIWRLEQSA